MALEEEVGKLKQKLEAVVADLTTLSVITLVGKVDAKYDAKGGWSVTPDVAAKAVAFTEVRIDGDIREKGCRVGHAPAGARWTDRPAFARERDETIVAAALAANAGEAVCEDSALQITTELVLHEARVAGAQALARVGEECLEILPHDAMKHGELRPPARVAGLAA